MTVNTKRAMAAVEVARIDLWSVEGPLDDFIGKLHDIREKHLHAPYLSLSITYAEEEEFSTPKMVIMGHREETDVEFAARVEHETNDEELEEAWEREELERLQAKYGPDLSGEGY